jgi:hypothetical protein
MKYKLHLLAIILVFCALALPLGQTKEARAIGPSTNNSTIPNFAAGDQPKSEIKPSVNSTLIGPTSQVGTAQPRVIIDFMGTSQQDKLKVTGNEIWYLQIDINNPGWLYIFEYFPAGSSSPGKWLAYKWEIAQSGLWELGPFTPDTNEPEGEHIYRAWFFSEGRWAGEDTTKSPNNVVYWTYSKRHSAAPPPAPIAPKKEVTFTDRVFGFIINPITLVIAILVLVILVGLYLSRKYGWLRKTEETLLPSDADIKEESVVVPSAPAIAKLSLPSGGEISIGRSRRIIGRTDLARALTLNELGLISRRHFQIKMEGEEFCIEDLGSANGTRLNGTDIRSKGSVTLNDNDTIEPAGATLLTFYIL